MTYQEIKDAILVLLDVDLLSTGDIATQVEVHMKMVMDEIATQCKPIELLDKATDSAVVDGYTSIPLFSSSPGFGITASEYMKPLILFVDNDSTDDIDAPHWDFKPFTSWLRRRRTSGDSRPSHSWTINESDEVILRNWPGDNTTWEATLYYYKNPAAIVLSNSPELSAEHHKIIIHGTVIAFPSLFAEEAQRTLIMHQSKYAMGLRDIKNSGQTALQDLQFNLAMPSPTSTTPRGRIWGDYQTS